MNGEPMNLVPNAGTLLGKSYAVWAGYIAGACALVVAMLPEAPAWIQSALPVTSIVDTAKWLAAIFAFVGVPVGRIVAQKNVGG